MTKSLTEQWKNGELKQGAYYIQWSYDCDPRPSYMVDIFEYVCGFLCQQHKYIDEIICAVPSYEEYNKLKKQLKDAKKEVKEFVNESAYLLERCNSFLSDKVALANKVEKLEQQLAEAHNCINHCRTHPCCQKYLDKWGMK